MALLALEAHARTMIGRYRRSRRPDPSTEHPRQGAHLQGLLPLRRKSHSPRHIRSCHDSHALFLSLSPSPEQPGDYQLALALAGQGKVDLKPLVTHRYSFDDAVQAFQTVRAGKSEDGRPVIKAIISGPDVSPDDLLY